MRSMTRTPRASRPARFAIARACPLLGAAIGILLATGCGSETVATQPTVDVSTLYWALALDHRAVTMSTAAPFDTVRLTATALNPSGDTLTGLGAAIFTSTDLQRVRVDANGVVHALAVGSAIQVIATLRAGNMTHTDTATIDVTDDPAPHPIASLSIHPAPPDSAKLAMGSFPKFLAARMLDADGQPIDGVAVDYRSSDPTIASVDRELGFVTGNRPGRVTIVASATAYGATRADTLAFTIGLPVRAIVGVADSLLFSTRSVLFAPSEVRVGPGAAVVWIWAADIPGTDVTFDDPSNVAERTDGGLGSGAHTGAGNIPAQANCSASTDFLTRIRECFKARVFPVPGVYPYRSTLTGATGRIVVVDERDAAAP
jgi:plastocyanin